MTIPIQPFNPQSPTVHQGQFEPNPWTTGVPNLIQLLALFQSDKQFAERQKIAQGELTLQQQQEARIARENEMKQETTRQEGEALQALLASFMRPSGSTVAQAMQASGVQPAPGSPYETLARTAQDLPSAAVPGAVRGALPVVSGLAEEQQKAQQRADRMADLERALSAVPVEKREGARALVTFAEHGANLPADVQRGLFPNLFPPGKEIDPATMNAATTRWVTGFFRWGEIRSQFGLPKTPGVDDDMKFTPLPTARAAGRAAELQAKAANFLTQMQTANAILTPLENKTGGLSALGQYVKEAQAAVRAGEKSGLLGTLTRMAARKMLNSDQQQLVVQSLNFADAWRFMISGQSSSDTEGLRILNNVTGNGGDTPETLQLKQNMREMMVQGVADIAKGIRTRSEVIETALRQNWTAEQKQWLRKQLQDAKRYELELATDTAPYIADPTPPATPSAAADRIQQMYDSSQKKRVVP